MRARAGIETTKRGGERQAIVITEIPYQVNKARLIEKIAELVREKRIEGISDLRDESDREGIRIVVELKRGEVAEVILNQLYKLTQMQSTFGIILLAIVDNQPKVLTLARDAAPLPRPPEDRDHPAHPLRPAQGRGARPHPRGLLKALDHLDEVITTIRQSANAAGSARAPDGRFGFTQPRPRPSSTCACSA